MQLNVRTMTIHRRAHLERVVARPRLFAELDRALGGFAWISASTGTGKTSLMSSWLLQRRHETVWFTVDRFDEDPDSFLRDFARALDIDTSVLPLVVCDDEDLTWEARNFFSACLAHASHSLVLVFDDCHVLQPDSPFFRLLDALVTECVAHVTVLAASRAALPPALSHWQSDERFVNLGWQALRCTPSESAEIAWAAEHTAARDRPHRLAHEATPPSRAVMR